MARRVTALTATVGPPHAAPEWGLVMYARTQSGAENSDDVYDIKRGD